MSVAGSALDLRLKPVLMATDLSPASVKPHHHALAIAGQYKAKLYVAHVVSSVPYLMAAGRYKRFYRSGSTCTSVPTAEARQQNARNGS